MDVLRNAEYRIEWTDSGRARLFNGIFREKYPEVPESTLEKVITLENRYAAGDINGDGRPDAAVVLVARTGGTGVFYYLAVVLNQNGSPINVVTYYLGDRISVKSIEIRRGEVIATLLIRAEDEPMCAKPAVKITRAFIVHGAGLYNARHEPRGVFNIHVQPLLCSLIFILIQSRTAGRFSIV